MTEAPRSQGWGQIVPGVLTAAAGVITAVAGLLVASHLGELSMRRESASATRIDATIQNSATTTKEGARERPPASTAPNTPPGIDFVFETGISLNERQLEIFERLEAKIGILWALLSAVTLWGLKKAAADPLQLPQHPSDYLLYTGIALLAAGFCVVLAALVPQKFYPIPIKYTDMQKWANDPPGKIKEVFLEGLLVAFNHNETVIRRKSRMFQWSLFLTSGGVIMLGAGLLHIGVPLHV
jgi:hypothetical protein